MRRTLVILDSSARHSLVPPDNQAYGVLYNFANLVNPDIETLLRPASTWVINAGLQPIAFATSAGLISDFSRASLNRLPTSLPASDMALYVVELM